MIIMPTDKSIMIELPYETWQKWKMALARLGKTQREVLINLIDDFQREVNQIEKEREEK